MVKETKVKKENTKVEEKIAPVVKRDKTRNIKVLSAVLITMLITILLTWVITGKYYYNGSLIDIESSVGFFDLINYPIISISNFGNIFIYILVIGGFYGVLSKIDAYNNLLNKLAYKFRNKSTLLFIILIILLAIFTSVCGASLGLLIIVPFVVSLILKLGYSKIAAALVTVGSISVGLLGNTLSSTYVTSQNGLVGQNGIGQLNAILNTHVFDFIGVKVLILVLGLIILIVNTIKYIKNNPSKSLMTSDKLVSESKSKKSKIWPMVLVLDLTLIIMLLSLTSWTSVFKITIFDEIKEAIIAFSLLNATAPIKMIICLIIIELLVLIIVKVICKKKGKNINKKALLIVACCDVVLIILSIILAKFTHVFSASIFKNINKGLSSIIIFKEPIFAKLLGVDYFNAFECWTVVELSGLLLFASIILAIIYRVNYKELIRNFIDGAKDAIKPAVIVVLIYAIFVMAYYKPITLTIVAPMVDKFNVFKMSLAAFITSIFNVDLRYAASSVLPYAITKITDVTIYPVITLIWQAMYGLFTLVAPTSVILMVILSYLHVSYKEWLKASWKLIVELLVLALVVITLATLIL